MAKESIDLDNTKICINETAEYGPTEFFSKRLSLKVTTWLKMYKNLETTDYRIKFRNITVTMAKNLFDPDNIYISEPGSFAKKFALCAPYHCFLTTVNKAEVTYNQPFSVSFHEIIDASEGEIVESFHINFMVEMLWLAIQYMLAAQVPKMTVLYGMWLDPCNELDIPFDIDFVEVENPNNFGCHHSKISILKYKDDKVRIIIGSANLYSTDWETRTEGLWISPLLPRLPESADDSDGESPTNFKKDFIEYLQSYKVQEVFGWEALIHRTDCSAINVFFLASIPGSHTGQNLNSWAIKKLSHILSSHVTLPSDSKNWPLIAQSSSVGVFGNNLQSWLAPNILMNMSQEKDKKIIFMPELKFIFPSQKNYKGSYDDEIGHSCLMYDEENYKKQKWLNEYLYQWKSDEKGRSLALPHCKCYTRLSPDETEIAWFILTSSNLSKGAWGKISNCGNYLNLNNYEAGVVFIPQFVINQTTFPVKESTSSDAPVFLLPYDLPLIPYEADDEPRVFTTIKDEELALDLETNNKSNELLNIIHKKVLENQDENSLKLENVEKSDNEDSNDEGEGLHM